MKKRKSIGLGNDQLYSTLSIAVRLVVLIAFFVGFLATYDSYFVIETTPEVMNRAIRWGMGSALLFGTLALWLARWIYKTYYDPHEGLFPIDPDGGTRITRIPKSSNVVPLSRQPKQPYDPLEETKKEAA